MSLSDDLISCIKLAQKSLTNQVVKSSDDSSTNNTAHLIKDLMVTAESTETALVQWTWNQSPMVTKTQLQFMRVVRMLTTGSDCFQSSQITDPQTTEYKLNGLDKDTEYQICIQVFKKRVTSSTTLSPLSNSPEDVETHCRFLATSLWHLPASIGSSLGAMLALGIIILIVFFVQSRRKSRFPGQLPDDQGTGNHGGELKYGMINEDEFFYQQSPAGAGSMKDGILTSDDNEQLHHFYVDEEGHQFIYVGSAGDMDSGHLVSLPGGDETSESEETCITLPEGTFQCSCGFVHVLHAPPDGMIDENSDMQIVFTEGEEDGDELEECDEDEDRTPVGGTPCMQNNQSICVTVTNNEDGDTPMNQYQMEDDLLVDLQPQWCEVIPSRSSDVQNTEEQC